MTLLRHKLSDFAGQGRQGGARRGSALPGEAWQAWRGEDRRGKAWQGQARLARHGRQGGARRGPARKLTGELLTE